MPSHYGSSAKQSKSSSKKKKYRPLTESQKKQLEKHSKHHSKKHMEMMKRDMRYGACFSCAHKKAMKKVGK